MSGPKSGGWHIVTDGSGLSLGELQRLLIHYRECILRFQKQLAALKRRDPSVHINLGPETLADDGQLTALSAVVSELNNRYDIYIRLRDELDRGQRLVAEREAERSLQLLNSLEISQNIRRPRPSDKASADLAALRQKVELAAARLDPLADEKSRAEIAASLKRAEATKDVATAELNLAHLRIKVEQINDNCRKVALAQQRADAEAFEALQRVHAQPSESAADRSHQAKVAAEILKHTLEELGYEVQPDFATAFAEGESSFFQLPSWGEYHCQVTTDPDLHRLNLNIVRYGEAQQRSADGRLRDREMEETWCNHVPNLLQSLEANHLSVSLDRRFEAGAIEMQSIKDSRLKPKTRAKPNAGQIRERSR